MRDFVSTKNVRRSGCADGAGFGGEQALRLENSSVGSARDFLSFPDIRLGKDSFTLRLWVKAERGACHGWCCGDDFLPVADTTDPELYTPVQQAHGSILLSNTVFESRKSVGLTVAHLQPRAFLTVQFMPEGAQAPVQLTGVRATYDGRWHAVTLSCDREGLMLLFVDEKLCGQADIAAHAGKTLGDTPLNLGADARGENGFGPGWVSRFSFEARAWSAGEIANAYYKDACELLLEEMKARGLEESGIYDAAEARAFLAHAREIADADTRPQVTYTRLRQAYEAFLLRTREPDLKFAIVSDVHCNGEEGGRTVALRRGLRWANELGIQALMDCGDYSDFGKDFELDSYWNAIADLWAGKPLFVTVGNHETLHRKCHELVRYHCDHLHAQGMVPEGYDKFFYEGECNGYHFIVLAQYSDTYTVTGYKRMWRYAGEIKQEQIDFLKERLETYRAEGKPVFLVIHNSMRALLDQQTGGKFLEDSAIINGDALYDVLAGHPEAVICTGHVHHGFGGGAGFHHMKEDYNVIDANGFRGGVIGYCIGDRDPVGSRHGAYFVFVFGRTLLLRAVDFATGEWLTAYDQTVTLDL